MIALKNNLILRSPRSGRLEGRTMPIQRSGRFCNRRIKGEGFKAAVSVAGEGGTARLFAAVTLAYLLPMDAAGDVIFERVLLPHRSLPPAAFHVLMLLLGLVSMAMGIGFLLLGAWPICGFFGLDVAAVYVAFRLSYRSARQREILRLAGDDFTVERVDIYGERRRWRFQPFWLKVVIEERPDESNRLLLASHGKSMVIGDFLGAPMRRELAQSLRLALSRWRAALNPTNTAS